MHRRIAALTLATLTACSGYGGAFVPRGVPGDVPSTAASNTRQLVNVFVRMRIPSRHLGETSKHHPATISPLTQSVSIGVNGHAEQIFNATPGSRNCAATKTGTLCTFRVGAPAGPDTFVITTYDAPRARGALLDRGTAVIKVLKGRANSFQIMLSPLVSTTADSGIGSLRYAVENAKAGDTIVFALPANAKISVSSVITPAVNVTIAGPGVKTVLRPRVNLHGVHGSTTYDGITLDGGSSQQIFSIGSSISVTISGLVLSNGHASVGNQPGGAIGNYGALTLASDAIIDNDSIVNARLRARSRHTAREHLRPHCAGVPQYGGGVYNEGSLTITDSTFDGNVVSDVCQDIGSAGGAILNNINGTLTVTGSTFTNNFGQLGGAVANLAGTQPTFDRDAFTGNGGCGPLNGCASSSCTIQCATYPHGNGSAIYDNSGVGAVITNSTFTANVAGGNAAGSIGGGGAVFLSGGAYTITGDVFTGNVAGGGSTNCSLGQGGAIFDIDSGFTGLQLDNDAFSNNSAGGDAVGTGGAVMTLGQLFGSDDTFGNNLATATGSSCAKNAAAGGGAVSANGIALNDSTFTGNMATANSSAAGGAIATSGASSLGNDIFSKNEANVSGLYGAATPTALGGAVNDAAASPAPLGLANDTFSSNSATAASAGAYSAMGGAVATVSGITLNSSKDSFSANAATAPSGVTSGVAGGAVAAGGAFYSGRDTFTNNLAQGPNIVEGGAAFAQARYGFGSDTFGENSVSSNGGIALGGALYLQIAGTLVATTFTANSASPASGIGFGGGIFGDSSTTLAAVTLANNVATNAGGGMYANGGALIESSTIAGNRVTPAATYLGGGGGVYGVGVLGIFDTTISGNSVTTTQNDTGGGGIYNGGYLTLTASTISGNAVTASGTGDGGGGIFNENGATLENDTIAGNTSNADGGGIDAYDPSDLYTENVTNVTLYQNKATGNGGNIYNSAQLTYSHMTEVTLTNSIVAGGSAANGADIYNVHPSMLSNDYNVIGSATTGILLAAHDRTATDPKLLPLANNGGPTLTDADQSTSPGRNIPYSGGNKCGNAVAIYTDQRGYSRGTGGLCDAGAYEFAGIAPAIKLHPPKLRVPSGKSHARFHPPLLHVPSIRVPRYPGPGAAPPQP